MIGNGGGADPMPAAEIAIDAGLLRTLVVNQFPQYSHLPVTVVANGWDNVVARLGDDLALRVPRRAAAVELIEHESRWLPRLAADIPVEIPVPVHRGAPHAGVPWPWAIVRWVPGEPADRAVRRPDRTDVDAMARALRALHRSAPPDAPINPYRGGPLVDRDGRVTQHLRRIDHPRIDTLRALWADAIAAPPHDGAPCWIHGDLHPANLVVRDGAFVGILDWGDLAGGDPAADLQVAWTWLDRAGGARLLAALEVDPATVERARGNALAHGLAVLASSADSPRMAAIGRRTVDRVLEDVDA